MNGDSESKRNTDTSATTYTKVCNTIIGTLAAVGSSISVTIASTAVQALNQRSVIIVYIHDWMNGLLTVQVFSMISSTAMHTS